MPITIDEPTTNAAERTPSTVRVAVVRALFTRF
jgi:hypothetical protein